MDINTKKKKKQIYTEFEQQRKLKYNSENFSADAEIMNIYSKFKITQTELFGIITEYKENSTGQIQFKTKPIIWE